MCNSSSKSKLRACKNNCAILATFSYFSTVSGVLRAVLPKYLVTPQLMQRLLKKDKQQHQGWVEHLKCIETPRVVLEPKTRARAPQTLSKDRVSSSNVCNNPTLASQMKYTDPQNPFLKREVFYFFGSPFDLP